MGGKVGESADGMKMKRKIIYPSLAFVKNGQFKWNFVFVFYIALFLIWLYYKIKLD